MSEHIVSRSVYFAVFAALVVLTLVTYAAARVNFGSEAINTIVALVIAVTKATLVILFFMHVRYSPRLTWVVIASGLLWLAIMIGITLLDYKTRLPSALPGAAP
jgi:cytochrome c oxidase subunit IV